MKRYTGLLALFYNSSRTAPWRWWPSFSPTFRFETSSSRHEGYRVRQYVNVLPSWPSWFPRYYLQGIYRLRRGRSRVDDFFAVFVGSILAVVMGVGATLYIQTYYLSEEAKAAGIFEVSQAVWALFLILNVALTYSSRELVRQTLERRWRAGIGLKRILIAGAGDLGRLVADKILEHRELGYRIVGFVDDRAREGDHIGHRGLPLLGTLADAGDRSRDVITSTWRCRSKSTSRCSRSSTWRAASAST